MSKADYPYPDDEFDATDPATPLGVHRAPRTWWSRWWPFVVVVLVAPVLAFLAVTYAADQDTPSSGSNDNPTTSAPPTSEEPSSSETASTPAEEPAETPEETPSEEPAAEPDTAAGVLVLNGSGISGLAGRTGEDLESAGFTNVSTGNYSGDLDASTVFYASEELRATADLVAQTIGVDAVELDPAEAGDAITVVLITDPAA